MSSLQLTVQVFEEFEPLVPRGLIERAVEATLAEEPEASQQGVSVVIADDETVRELNRKHRGLDENTDVLSFSFTHEGEYYGDDQPSSARAGEVEFVLPPGETPGLGEVIISYPQAERQAVAAGHSIEQELVALLAHGVLHLLGYDHVEPDEEAVMNARQARVLSRVLEQA